MVFGQNVLQAIHRQRDQMHVLRGVPDLQGAILIPDS
jgi:hypothetical protein